MFSILADTVAGWGTNYLTITRPDISFAATVITDKLVLRSLVGDPVLGCYYSDIL